MEWFWYIIAALGAGVGTGLVGLSAATVMVPILIVLCPSFTALIASVSHIMIHPAIFFEKWDVMLLCIIVVTTASLISARFANRVNNRTVGLVTGVVLTVLGVAMIILNYWVK